MEFLKALKMLLLIYAAWYGGNLLLDMLRSGKSSASGEKKTVEIIKQSAGEDNAAAELAHEAAPRRVGLEWDDNTAEQQSNANDHARYMPQTQQSEQSEDINPNEVVNETGGYTDDNEEADNFIEEEDEAESMRREDAAEMEGSLQADLGLESVGDAGYSAEELEHFNREDFGYAA
jgi:hypothetical protein